MKAEGMKVIMRLKTLKRMVWVLVAAISMTIVTVMIVAATQNV